MQDVLDFTDAETAVDKMLETYDCAKVVAEGADVEMHYRAFTDRDRGRIKIAGVDAKDAERGLATERKKCEATVFSAAQLFKLKPVYVETRSLGMLLECWLRDYMPNLYFGHEVIDQIASHAKIELRYLANVNLGSDESWTLATVWFEHKPCMVVTYYGEDNFEHFITDTTIFGEMMHWVYTFIPCDRIVSPDKPLPQYTEFWGYTLEDYYDPQTQQQRKLKNGGWHYGPDQHEEAS